MVEINNQRKAFLDMLAWSEGTDNGRQKTRNHGYDVIVGELFTIVKRLLDHPRKLHKPKTQINRRRTLPASFPLVGCLPQAAWPESFTLRKVSSLALKQIEARRFTYKLIVVISVRAIDRCSKLTAGRAGYGQFRRA